MQVWFEATDLRSSQMPSIRRSQLRSRMRKATICQGQMWMRIDEVRAFEERRGHS